MATIRARIVSLSELTYEEVYAALENAQAMTTQFRNADRDREATIMQECAGAYRAEICRRQRVN